jgi:hypothetical protein
MQPRRRSRFAQVSVWNRWVLGESKGETALFHGPGPWTLVPVCFGVWAPGAGKSRSPRPSFLRTRLRILTGTARQDWLKLAIVKHCSLKREIAKDSCKSSTRF